MWACSPVSGQCLAFSLLGADDPASCSAASSSTSDGSPKPNSDSFDEVYKPLELTDFDTLFSKNIARTSEMYVCTL